MTPSFHWVGLGWVWSGWVGLGRVGLGWIGSRFLNFIWVGLGWVSQPMGWVGLGHIKKTHRQLCSTLWAATCHTVLGVLCAIQVWWRWAILFEYFNASIDSEWVFRVTGWFTTIALQSTTWTVPHMSNFLITWSVFITHIILKIQTTQNHEYRFHLLRRLHFCRTKMSLLEFAKSNLRIGLGAYC